MPKKPILVIKDLEVSLPRRKEPILSKVNLQLNKGECLALLGPNGSGKTVLTQVIAGNKHYRIKQGKIYFQSRLINTLSPEQRVKLGIALAWQSPPAIPGVTLKQLLSKINREQRNLSSGVHLLNREINVGFSGGEKKISELMQLLALQPKLVILDEIDSGLDFNKLKEVVRIIRQKFLDQKIAVLLITHNGQILNLLKPQKTLVMIKGTIICEDKDYKQVLKTIKKYGYKRCYRCALSSNR